MKEVVIDQGGVLAVISDGTGELVAQIPRAQLQGRGLPEVGQGLKVMPDRLGTYLRLCTACARLYECKFGVRWNREQHAMCNGRR